IGDHGVGACHQARRVGGRRGGEPRIAVSHDHAIAVRVDEDRGDRRGHAGKALAAGAVDLFARQRGPPPVAVRILAGRTAGPASVGRPPSRATATAALAAQPPLTMKKLCAWVFASGCGKRSTRNTSSSTMMPAHKIARALSPALAELNLFLHFANTFKGLCGKQMAPQSDEGLGREGGTGRMLCGRRHLFEPSAMSRSAPDLRVPVMLNTSSPILPAQRSQWPLDVFRSEKTCARPWRQEVKCWTSRW